MNEVKKQRFRRLGFAVIVNKKIRAGSHRLARASV
jgi:hypothetical protein